MGLILYTLEGGQWIRKKSLSAKNKISLPEERNLPPNKKNQKEREKKTEKKTSGDIKINIFNLIIILVLKGLHAFKISNKMEWYEINLI